MNTLPKAFVPIKDNPLEISLVRMSIVIPINRPIDEAGFTPSISSLPLNDGPSHPSRCARKNDHMITKTYMI